MQIPQLVFLPSSPPCRQRPAPFPPWVAHHPHWGLAMHWEHWVSWEHCGVQESPLESSRPHWPASHCRGRNDGLMHWCESEKNIRVSCMKPFKQNKMEHSIGKNEDKGSRAYPLQGHTPYTVLPTSIRASGAQAQSAIVKSVTWRRARHWWRRLHLHGWDVEQGVAETCPVIGGVYAQDAPRLTCGNVDRCLSLNAFKKAKGNILCISSSIKLREGKFSVSLRHFKLTCALELPRPHAFSGGSALRAIGGLAAGLSAVAGQEDLSLVDPTVMLRCAADWAANTGTLWAVCAPLALQRRLKKNMQKGWAISFHRWPSFLSWELWNVRQRYLFHLWQTRKSLWVPGETFTAGLEPATLVSLTRCWGAGGWSSDASHSDLRSRQKHSLAWAQTNYSMEPVSNCMNLTTTVLDISHLQLGKEKLKKNISTWSKTQHAK